MKYSLLVLLFAFMLNAQAQEKYFAKDAKVYFLSDTKLEKIEATNNKGVCVIDATTGAMEFSVLIAGFQFEKALMQEHFQENYMEMSKFPKATFKGNIKNVGTIKWAQDGNYEMEVVGKLTLHGVTKDITNKANVAIKSGVPMAISSFEVLCADYNINIPSLVKDKVDKSVKIDIAAKLQKLAK